jgi:hypothetical protein
MFVSKTQPEKTTAETFCSNKIEIRTCRRSGIEEMRHSRVDAADVSDPAR